MKYTKKERTVKITIFEGSTSYAIIIENKEGQREPLLIDQQRAKELAKLLNIEITKYININDL